MKMKNTVLYLTAILLLAGCKKDVDSFLIKDTKKGMMSIAQPNAAPSGSICFNYTAYLGEIPIACASGTHMPGDPRPCEYENSGGAAHYISNYGTAYACTNMGVSGPTPPPGTTEPCGGSISNTSSATGTGTSSFICDPYSIQEV